MAVMIDDLGIGIGYDLKREEFGPFSVIVRGWKW